MYLDEQGEMRMCSSDLDRMTRQKIEKQWRDSKSLSTLLVLLKIKYDYLRQVRPMGLLRQTLHDLRRRLIRSASVDK